MSKQVEQSVDVDVPAESFYELITDFAAYPEFLSSCVSTRVLKQEGEVYDVEFTVRVIRQIDYVLRLSGKPYESLSWTLIKPGLFTANDGGWRLEALTDTTTRATYRLAVEVSRFVPQAITAKLVESTLPEMLEQWKAHAEARYRAQQGA